MTVRTTQPHGTENSYGNLGCRCDKCREAHRVYYMSLRPCPHCGGPKSFAKELCSGCSPAWQIKHGLTRYRKGCRCGICVASIRAYWGARQAIRRKDASFRAKENARRQSYRERTAV